MLCDVRVDPVETLLQEGAGSGKGDADLLFRLPFVAGTEAAAGQDSNPGLVQKLLLQCFGVARAGATARSCHVRISVKGAEGQLAAYTGDAVQTRDDQVTARVEF